MAITDRAVTVTADANGVAIAEITPYRRQVWIVSQVSVEMVTAVAETICSVFKGSFLITPMVAGSDAASGDPPVTLRPGEKLSVRWRNAPVGAEGRALFIYDDGVE